MRQYFAKHKNRLVVVYEDFEWGEPIHTIIVWPTDVMYSCIPDSWRGCDVNIHDGVAIGYLGDGNYCRATLLDGGKTQPIWSSRATVKPNPRWKNAKWDGGRWRIVTARKVRHESPVWPQKSLEI